MRMKDKEDYEIERLEILVEPDYIPAGGRGDYDQGIPLPSYCESVDLNVLWEWVPPDE